MYVSAVDVCTQSYGGTTPSTWESACVLWRKPSSGLRSVSAADVRHRGFVLAHALCVSVSLLEPSYRLTAFIQQFLSFPHVPGSMCAHVSVLRVLFTVQKPAGACLLEFKGCGR